ncbi:tyrosine-type recombinase/integrase [Gammaproteobacteria bacterium]|nr:tyrosine-type recombinase/integrase [Gammaproteobacteria bacterium]
MTREINIKIVCPEMTALKYATESGMDKQAFKHLEDEEKGDKENAQIINDWMQRKYIPSVKTGKHRNVNVVGRILQLIELYEEEKKARERSAGSRWSEAQELRGEQVRDCKIQFAETKNSKSRLMPINKKQNDLIFDGRMRRGRLFKDCKKEFKDALTALKIQLPKGQLTHVLRHSYAVHFMLNRGNILDLQKMLGHKTLNQTIRYAQFHPDYLQDAISKNPWGRLI